MTQHKYTNNQLHEIEQARKLFGTYRNKRTGEEYTLFEEDGVLKIKSLEYPKDKRPPYRRLATDFEKIFNDYLKPDPPPDKKEMKIKWRVFHKPKRFLTFVRAAIAPGYSCEKVDKPTVFKPKRKRETKRKPQPKFTFLQELCAAW